LKSEEHKFTEVTFTFESTEVARSAPKPEEEEKKPDDLFVVEEAAPQNKREAPQNKRKQRRKNSYRLSLDELQISILDELQFSIISKKSNLMLLDEDPEIQGLIKQMNEDDAKLATKKDLFSDLQK